jgi:glycosyltransferase involved in cell wall biosynthesis
VPTPQRDWRTAVVDAIVPARNEERTIALALDSLLAQDFPLRRVTIVDDASTDRTAEVVRRYAAISGYRLVTEAARAAVAAEGESSVSGTAAKPELVLVSRPKAAGKTPSVRAVCETSDADVLFVLDGDTVLKGPDYISRTVEELFRNAGVASVCGEVMPLARETVAGWRASHPHIRQLVEEYGPEFGGPRGGWYGALVWLTQIYRSALYLFLHRIIYDGHLKLLGGTLNPAGCAVAYHRPRLADCFAYAKPRVGDNLSVSEDIFIGHFLNWKGYRNVHIRTAHCESTEPPITSLWRQLFLWSSSFLQSLHYFPSLPSTIFKWPRFVYSALRWRKKEGADRRRNKEQYRAAWGEAYTVRYGRPVGVLDVTALVEKITFPVILIGLAITEPVVAGITVAAEAILCTTAIAIVADRGARIRSAGAMLAATPIRLLSLFVDVAAILWFLVDLAVGNREWRK